VDGDGPLQQVHSSSAPTPQPAPVASMTNNEPAVVAPAEVAGSGADQGASSRTLSTSDGAINFPGAAQMGTTATKPATVHCRLISGRLVLAVQKVMLSIVTCMISIEMHLRWSSISACWSQAHRAEVGSQIERKNQKER
jgi:hypothetical protein